MKRIPVMRRGAGFPPRENSVRRIFMSHFSELVSLCKGHHVYIQTHNFPDPDAIASAFGLQKLLGMSGISAEICYAGRIDRKNTAKMMESFGIEILSYEQLRDRMCESDYIICVDSQKNGGNIADFAGNEVACIDHHPVFVNTDYRYADIRITGACATLIAEYYARLGLTPDGDTATALLYGLKMDTLQFTRGVTPLDIEMFAFLFPLCDQKKLTQLEHNNMEFSDLKAYGAAIEGIELYGRMGFSYISFACPDAQIAVISDFILSLAEVEIAVVASCRADGIKLSVRSENPNVHAGQLIRAALDGIGDGGGHAAMAGGLVKRERLHLLGRYPENRLRELLLETLEKV